MSQRPELLVKMRDVARALWAGESPRLLVGQLLELARESELGDGVWRFAHRELALLASAEDPWKASLLSRRLLAVDPHDHVGWATLALAQSLLGNSRYAIRCYERALKLSPRQPRYAHNLGHLYDVALGAPERALPLLAQAHAWAPRCTHTAASYAHALGRVGRAKDGLSVLLATLPPGMTRDQAELLRWLRTEADRAQPAD